MRASPLRTLVVEGHAAKLRDASTLTLLGEIETLEHLSLAHTDMEPSAWTPLYDETLFPALKSLARTGDPVRDATFTGLTLRDFHTFGSGFEAACRDSGVAAGGVGD